MRLLLVAISSAFLLSLAACTGGEDGAGAQGDSACTGRGCEGETGGEDAGEETGTGPVTDCDSDGDCRDRWVCHATEAVCVPPCGSDADCAPIDRCDATAGYCVSRTSCVSPADCALEETCNTCLDVCVPSTGGAQCRMDANCPDFDQYCDTCLSECRALLGPCEPCFDDRECGTTDDDCLDFASGGRFCGRVCGAGMAPCPLGYQCDATVGQCVPISGDCSAVLQCESDAECGGGRVCSGTGLCVVGCVGDNACPTGQVCSGGRCAAPCTTSAECASGAECVEGRCRIPGGCASSADCELAETYCDRSIGMCVPGCQVDDDCQNAARECVGGACIRRACRGAYACAFGQFCDLEAGACVDAEGDYCASCDGDDVDSCGTSNVCAAFQDGSGTDYGAFCFVACSSDPVNDCPQGYDCEDVQISETETRRVCTRPCPQNPVGE